MLCGYDFEFPDEEALLEGLLECEADKYTESVLLRMFDADDTIPAKKKVTNKEYSQHARDADKLFVRLMEAELKEMLETFELYATYTRNLSMHGSCDKEGMRLFEQRHTTHKDNVAFLEGGSDDPSDVKPQMRACAETESKKTRNRKHAQKSRQKRIRHIRDLTAEREEVFVTLEHIVKHTTVLESSCDFLNDLNEYVSAHMMQIREKLVCRTCAHQDKYPKMRSHLTFRGTYRENFK